MKAYQRISEKSISLKEIPNLLPVTKITPKKNKENIRVTQVHGSMEGKKILEKVSAIKDELTFLRGKSIKLFVTPPDTTGVTQLLDQINQKLHSENRSAKSELFTLFLTINRESFMKIVAMLWPEWASKETIINASKKVGISSGGFSVEWMQEDKFSRAL